MSERDESGVDVLTDGGDGGTGGTGTRTGETGAAEGASAATGDEGGTFNRETLADEKGRPVESDPGAREAGQSPDDSGRRQLEQGSARAYGAGTPEVGQAPDYGATTPEVGDLLATGSTPATDGASLDAPDRTQGL